MDTSVKIGEMLIENICRGDLTLSECYGVLESVKFSLQKSFDKTFNMPPIKLPEREGKKLVEHLMKNLGNEDKGCGKGVS